MHRFVGLAEISRFVTALVICVQTAEQQQVAARTSQLHKKKGVPNSTPFFIVLKRANERRLNIGIRSL